MTIVRTDNIVNLYPHAIVGISKDNPAVVTVPVIEQVVSATGTIGTVTGSGTTNAPWTAAITLMTTTVGLKSGDIITATAGSGDFAAGGEVSVKSVVGTQSITINKIGGTIPDAGTVTDISLPAISTLPAGFASSDVIQITGVDNGVLTFTENTPIATTFRATGCSVSGTTLTLGPVVAGTVAVNQVLTGVNAALNGLHIVSGSGSSWTLSASGGTLSNQVVTGILPAFVVGETITQTTTSAKGVVTSVTYDGSSSKITYNTPSNTFDTTHLVTGGTSNASMIPTATEGMTELLTAGLNNTNTYYVDVLTDNTFALYKNSALTTEVDSSAFTTAVANTGQYTTIDEVVITIPD